MKRTVFFRMICFLGALLPLLCSCDADLDNSPDEGQHTVLRIKVEPDKAKTVSTRMTEVQEKAIANIHALVYNSAGKLVGYGYSSSDELIVNTRSGHNYTIYAIANAGAKAFTAEVLANVNTEENLKKLTTDLLTSWDGLTKDATGIIMTGSKEGVDIQPGKQVPVSLTVSRMAARITLDIKAKAGSGIVIKDYQACSLPALSYYVTQEAIDAPSATTDSHWLNSDPVALDADATTLNTTFYMYENRQGVVPAITDQKDKGEANAPARATYVLIHGEVADKKVTWRVYLGANNTDDFNIKRNCTYTYHVALNGYTDADTDTRVTVEDAVPLVVGTPSNSYMIKPGSALTIPVVRANQTSYYLDGSTTDISGAAIQISPTKYWEAVLLWESTPGLITVSDNLGQGADKDQRFTVTANDSKQGNAVVACYTDDEEFGCVWSWHIWVTDYDGTQTITSDGMAFMDRALGATSNKADELKACGLLYQWGRKEPFIGLGQEGGAWTVSSDPVLMYDASGKRISVTRTPVPRIMPNCMGEAIFFPLRFYYNNNLTAGSSINGGKVCSHTWYSLWSAAPARKLEPDLWGGVSHTKSYSDPCPDGWRVPLYSGTGGTSLFQEAIATGVSSTPGGHGRMMNSNNNVWPNSGFRDGGDGLGTFTATDTRGVYWTATAADDGGSYAFGSDDFICRSDVRVNAHAVRCVKE